MKERKILVDGRSDGGVRRVVSQDEGDTNRRLLLATWLKSLSPWDGDGFVNLLVDNSGRITTSDEILLELRYSGCKCVVGRTYPPKSESQAIR